MAPEIVIDLMHQAVLLLLMIVAVLIVPSVVVGLCVSVFQAATQINEQSLSFVPRLIVTFITILVTSGWITQAMTEFTKTVYEAIPHIIG